MQELQAVAEIGDENQARATILPMGVIINPPMIAWISPSSTSRA
jgi:hypothetical protein